jgi:hypothetical protein
MTDARLPGGWLYVMPWVALSNDGRALLASALMWCAQNETDGSMPDAVLGTLPGSSTAAIAELTLDAGLLHRTGDGWQLLQDWSETQTTRAQHEQRRKNTRERVRTHRNKTASNAVTNGVTNALHRGQDRTGQAAPKRDHNVTSEKELYNDEEMAEMHARLIAEETET